MSLGNISRGSTWASDEVSMLISIWADEKIQQQLDNCSRKRSVFEKIAKRLEAESEGRFTRSYQQVSEKIKQLKKAYKKVKDNNNLSGRSRKTFKHFDQMDRVMGDRPPSLFESSEQASIQGDADDDEFALEDPEEPDFDNNASLVEQDQIESSLTTTSSSAPSPAATATSSNGTPPLTKPSTVPNEDQETPVNKEKILSSRRGKSKKKAGMRHSCQLPLKLCKSSNK
ncbi:uncharacterized protein LOC125560657 [Nematostella vectensis]|uniref:uncharacterized protein LOC125560657 n=1 Tax=Nematostella vectensis TaxID=45351 RepID=UPI0020772C73|nr:uncharacterized protein LOC125560657 [Nematostella vectensis]